jgi:hypothetical protein
MRADACLKLCRFFGIVIRMYWDDHNPPHFHASYAGEEALVDIRSLSLFAGRLSPRAFGLVIEWATLHQRELLDDWNRARNQQPLDSIEPLQ